ncbi:tRNA adenosine(34) deaminase TadA [candidate division KSB1 bacterium 4484_87]|nr:MAG: tRNA adenosine(34) deaminase TadA [candidate division KSB1 bacterium 4484_87]
MNDHEKWMEQAFLEAEKAYRKKEIPVGAVIVFENKVIGRGHNLIESLQDPTAHAEMIAITAAANYLGTWRLEDAALYATLEPCPMCAGAVVNSRISRVVFGTQDSRIGACGTVTDVLSGNGFNHKIEVISGILQQKCEWIIKDFFKKLRSGSADVNLE